MQKIVVDIYGADAGPKVVLSGVARAIKENGIFPVFVGETALITEVMQSFGIEADKYEIIHTTDYITNNEPATVIFGGRDESSIALSYKRLKEDDECIALLSAGPTGALLVGSICRLGLLPTLKTPLLCSALPCANENLLTLLDCGAVIDCTANDLVRFAKMGNVFSKCYCGIEKPRVGLMSVGREDAKGSRLTLEAFAKLKELDINFIGNIEGSDMVSGYADVVVADGFLGNVLLKNTEAAGLKALKIIESLGIEDTEIVNKIKNALIQSFDFNSRGAATFLGTKKMVVKMHGCANEDTAVASVEQILRLHKADFSEELKKALLA
jgi:glycerol-3-phosphate acyltransferase PlsX